MRRIAGIFMLLVIGYFTAVPLLAVSLSDDDTVPACCRRDGKHHCGMSTPAESGAQFRQLSARCPLFPRAVTVQMTRVHAAPSDAAAIYAQIASHPAVHPQTRAVYRISLDRSRQKRGPPAIL